VVFKRSFLRQKFYVTWYLDEEKPWIILKIIPLTGLDISPNIFVSNLTFKAKYNDQMQSVGLKFQLKILKEQNRFTPQS